MSGVTLGREQLRALMMRLHDVPPERRVAMTGRLQHFQRLGWPSNSNTGKGQRVKYNPDQVLQLALAFELIQLGSTPERIVDDLHLNTAAIWEANYAAAEAHANDEPPVLLVFNPASLSFALDPERSRRTYTPLLLVPLADMQDFLNSWSAAPNPRMAVINLSALIATVDQALSDLGIAKEGDFVGAISESATKMGETLDMIREVRGAENGRDPKA